MIYAWECPSCHHTWENTISNGEICEYCGTDGHYVGEYSNDPFIPSDIFKELVGGRREV